MDARHSLTCRARWLAAPAGPAPAMPPGASSHCRRPAGPAARCSANNGAPERARCLAQVADAHSARYASVLHLILPRVQRRLAPAMLVRDTRMRSWIARHNARLRAALGEPGEAGGPGARAAGRGRRWAGRRLQILTSPRLLALRMSARSRIRMMLPRRRRTPRDLRRWRPQLHPLPQTAGVQHRLAVEWGNAVEPGPGAGRRSTNLSS